MRCRWRDGRQRDPGVPAPGQIEVLSGFVAHREPGTADHLIGSECVGADDQHVIVQQTVQIQGAQQAPLLLCQLGQTQRPAELDAILNQGAQRCPAHLQALAFSRVFGELAFGLW